MINLRKIKIKQISNLIIEKGFSLVELLVTIAIISVLAAAGLLGYNKYILSAKRATNEANAKSLADALAAESVTPNICNEPATSDASGSYFDGTLINSKALISDHYSLVNCANKILKNNKWINPYTALQYGSASGGSNIAINYVGSNTDVTGNHQFLASLALYSLQSGPFNQSGSSYTDAYSATYNNSCAVVCSDQLSGQQIQPANPGESLFYYSTVVNNYSSYQVNSPAAGLIIVSLDYIDNYNNNNGGSNSVDKGPFAVATCDPFPPDGNNSDGALTKFFTINIQ